MRGSGDLSNKVAATSDLFSYEAKDPDEVQYYNNYITPKFYIYHSQAFKNVNPFSAEIDF